MEDPGPRPPTANRERPHNKRLDRAISRLLRGPMARLRALIMPSPRCPRVTHDPVWPVDSSTWTVSFRQRTLIGQPRSTSRPHHRAFRSFLDLRRPRHLRSNGRQGLELRGGAGHAAGQAAGGVEAVQPAAQSAGQGITAVHHHGPVDPAHGVARSSPRAGEGGRVANLHERRVCVAGAALPSSVRPESATPV